MQQNGGRKRKLGSYPFFSVIVSVTLSLFVMGLFGVLFILTHSLTSIIKENVEIQVYLQKPISSTEVTRIQKMITSKPFVLSKEGVPEIRHITQDEAARQFVEDTGEDFMKFLGDNPLRDVLSIKIHPDFQSLDSLAAIRREVENIYGVYEVSYVESLVESINKNLAKIGALLIGFSIVLLVMVVILINNTIKLALFSQRFLIRSMQLVGATSAFIQRPFLSRSVLYGMVAGSIASASLYLSLSWANKRIDDLASLQNDRELFILIGLLIFMGILVTLLSTYTAIRRYLKISLDELY